MTIEWRKAERAGVVVEESRRPDDVAAFYRTCDAVSDHKNFALSGSGALMQALVAKGEPEAPVRARLLVGRWEGKANLPPANNRSRAVGGSAISGRRRTGLLPSTVPEKRSSGIGGRGPSTPGWPSTTRKA